MTPTEHMHARRLFELRACLPILEQVRVRPSMRVLEIGAGTGFQAKVMAEAGFEVSAVEIASSPYRSERVFPVADYDGIHLPFEDGTFDAIFSSNVLEHVPHIEQFLCETKRVLAPKGICIHVLPTSAWRLWSMLSHYPWILKRVAMLATNRTVESPNGPRRPSVPKSASSWIQTLFPVRHGEHGNALTEIFHFGAAAWRRRFRNGGFAELGTQPTGLFYTNAALFGSSISMVTRQRLARALGSACRIYVLRKA